MIHYIEFLPSKQMHVYDDNHPLAKVPVNANVMINTAMFFYKIRNGLLRL